MPPHSGVVFAPAFQTMERPRWFDLYAADERDGAVDVLTVYPRELDAETLDKECGICIEPLSEPSGTADRFALATELHRYEGLATFARRRRTSADFTQDGPELLCLDGTAYDVLHTQCLLANAFTSFRRENGRLAVCLTEPPLVGVTLRFDLLAEDALWSLIVTEDEDGAPRDVFSAMLLKLSLLGEANAWARAAVARLHAYALEAVQPAFVPDAVWALRQRAVQGGVVRTLASLLRAIRANNVSRVREHLAVGIDPLADTSALAVDGGGTYATPLDAALRLNRAVIVDELVDALEGRPGFDVRTTLVRALRLRAWDTAVTLVRTRNLSLITLGGGAADATFWRLVVKTEPGAETLSRFLSAARIAERRYLLRDVLYHTPDTPENTQFLKDIIASPNFNAPADDSEALRTVLKLGYTASLVAELLLRGASALADNDRVLARVYYLSERGANVIATVRLLLDAGASPAAIPDVVLDGPQLELLVRDLVSDAYYEDFARRRNARLARQMARTPTQRARIEAIVASVLPVDDDADVAGPPHRRPDGAPVSIEELVAVLPVQFVPTATLVRARGRWFRHVADVFEMPDDTGSGMPQRGFENALARSARGSLWTGYRVLDSAPSLPIAHAWNVLADGTTVLDRTPLALTESAWYYGVRVPVDVARRIVAENSIGTKDVLDGVRFLEPEQQAAALRAIADANPLPDDAEPPAQRQRTSARISAFVAALLVL